AIDGKRFGRLRERSAFRSESSCAVPVSTSIGRSVTSNTPGRWSGRPPANPGRWCTRRPTVDSYLMLFDSWQVRQSHFSAILIGAAQFFWLRRLPTSRWDRSINDNEDQKVVGRGRPTTPKGHSSAPRSHPPKSAAPS